MFKKKIDTLFILYFFGTFLMIFSDKIFFSTLIQIILSIIGVFASYFAVWTKGKLENRGVILTLNELPIEKPMVVIEKLPEINAICICTKERYESAGSDPSRVVSVMFSHRYTSGMNFKISQYNITYFQSSNKKYFADGNLVIEIL